MMVGLTASKHWHMTNALTSLVTLLLSISASWSNLMHTRVTHALEVYCVVLQLSVSDVYIYIYIDVHVSV